MTNCCIRVAGSINFLNFVHSSGKYSAILAATRHGGETLCNINIELMPKILITGNGFDLNLGLPTSYSDFINILKSLDKGILEFSFIYSNCQHYSILQQNFKPFKIDGQNVDELKKLMKHNQWFKFFKDEYEIETWIDFENKIEYVLKILYSSVTYLKERIFSKGSLALNNLVHHHQTFNYNIEIIEVLNQFGVLSTHYDEVTLNKNLLIKKYNYYIDIDLDKITKNLYHELIDFKKIFNYYFEIFVFPLYDTHQVKINRSFFSKINKHYTFNYTPTFEKLYGNRSITKFLHGKINSIDNKIVLGINEIPKNDIIDNRFLLPFTKYFQKLNNNTDYAFIKEFDTKTHDNYSFFFWGHSLDKSDEDYINEVFDFLENLKPKNRKVTIIYHQEGNKSKLLLNILNVRGKKNVQDLMRSKVLQFLHIDSKELQQELNRDISQGTAISIH